MVCDTYLQKPIVKSTFPVTFCKRLHTFDDFWGCRFVWHPKDTKSGPPPGVVGQSGTLRTPKAVPHVDFWSISGRFLIDFRNQPPEATHKTTSDRVLWRDLPCPTSWVSAQHQMFYTSIRPHRFVTGRSNNHCCTIPKSSDSVSVLVFDMVASSSGLLFGPPARQK